MNELTVSKLMRTIKATPLVRTSSFKIDVKGQGEHDPYIVEIRESLQPEGRGRISCRVWRFSQGEETALEYPLDSLPRKLSKQRIARAAVGALFVLHPEARHED
mgnify:FL=1